MARNISTREKIKWAFLDLLNTKNYDEISVKDIMEEADGSRVNFYNYFSDKEDLRDQIINDDLKELDAEINEFFKYKRHFSNREDIFELNMIRFKHAYDRKELFRIFFTQECFLAYQRRLRDDQYKLLSRHFQNFYHQNPIYRSRNNNFTTFTIATSFVGSIEYCVRHNFEIPAKTICEYFTYGYFYKG